MESLFKEFFDKVKKETEKSPFISPSMKIEFDINSIYVCYLLPSISLYFGKWDFHFYIYFLHFKLSIRLCPDIFRYIEGSCEPHEFDTYIVYTLEEFLEKYPFKVGDKVFDTADGDPGIITAMKWDEDVSDMKYHVAFDNGDMGWYTNDTIGFLNEDDKEMNGNIETNHCKVNGLKRGDEYPIMEGVECNECIKYYFPEGYEFVDTDDTGVYLKPIKPKYPTTYEECCMVLQDACMTHKGGYKGNLIQTFQKLVICRDAYWKIAGEELGLGKPWEPNWDDEDEYKYGLFRLRNITYKDSSAMNPTLLIFPTQEMRDAFYENFKDLIEQCKELL